MFFNISLRQLLDENGISRVNGLAGKGLTFGAPQTILHPVSSISSVLHCHLGLGKLQACPFPGVVFPPLFLSASSSSPFHCALQDGFGQTWWMGDMSVPLQFAFWVGLVSVMGPFALCPGPGPPSAWLGLSADCCIYTWHLAQTWTKSLTSSSQTHHLFAGYTFIPQFRVPDGRWCTVECKPCLALLQSGAKHGLHPFLCWAHKFSLV